MNIEQINEFIVKQLSNEANIAMTKSFLFICTILVAVSNRCSENFLYKTVTILFWQVFQKSVVKFGQTFFGQKSVFFVSAINKITCYTSVNKDFLTCVGCILVCHCVTDYLGASEARASVAAGWEGRFGVCCWENTELEPEAEVPPPPPEVVCAGGGCGEDDVDGESFVNCCWADALARNSAARNCSKWNCCLSWNYIKFSN